MSTLQPASYVGFDTITSQIEHRLLKRGFRFNVMCVGESGLGKTTMVNTLFAAHLVDQEQGPGPARTTEISVSSHTLVEDRVKLHVNVVDTPGFGDAVDNSRCWEPIVKYCKEQHSQYLRRELTAQREREIPDTRVHAVLYFLNPANVHRGLSPLDRVTLRKLAEVANIVPVIGKADTLTLEERHQFRDLVQRQINEEQLAVYPYDHEATGADNEDVSPEEAELNSSIRAIVPFAVVGAETTVQIDGENVRGRRNRWGVINIEDINQCEFVYLREFLIRTHLQDLIETTAYLHYERFRARQLIALKENASNRSTQQQQQQASTQLHNNPMYH
ncbi:septin CDC10 KNAG_0I01130 [Huiozyma naganishii CBS 8797]|uniref:Cell division control protein 10 n=1 Tax=Huiozyma naganishii (strain ATCC MYA-139 / BCRC 22969 / CBS 8797 / KCTC 17520 / NBRC 10181 / NCYC 3082 / Yp74L-3) TaxID=1071383 RepID=J7S941_HUIN7|nr:hypothetical protein KNAG_0I01130 [Kazachstania naganishii CBS 8797]CCK71904.1 hypothetical protein KNAG_0I01130 [Kazachstania naganishii CBS 8797]